jgi:putative flippase GtrA
VAELRPIILQWSRFAAVGVSNTVLSTIVFGLLVRAGLHYVPASAIAFTLGALNSYVLNRRFTFRSTAARTPELGRFALVQVVGLATDLVLLSAAVDGLGLPRVAAQIMVFPAASAVTFVLARQWAFRSPAVVAAAGSG